MQQRTEIVDDASWIMGFLDIIDPAIDSIKKLLNFDQSMEDLSRSRPGGASSGSSSEGVVSDNGVENESGFDLDKFIRDKLSLDPLKLDIQWGAQSLIPRSTKSWRKVVQPRKRIAL